MYSYDNRVVITLDAGGTNLVFGAMQANKFIVEPITLPSHAEDLDRCLATMVEGFTAIIDKLDTKPVAISFAFPGPADYPNGIIGGYLPNFPSFREGVALGPFLEAKFGIPVFINNDGDLFAYGEALGGALPEVNARLEALGSPKKYRNLVGYTFGTGFGVGIVVDNRLNRGDNSCGENVTWTLADGTLTISGTGRMTNFTKDAPAPWADQADQITTVEVEGTVTSVGATAFKDCTALTTVNIADGVEYIEAGAFNGCTALTEVNIPLSVGYIKTGAFKGCTALTSVTIRDDCRLDMNVFPDTVEVNHAEG